MFPDTSKGQIRLMCYASLAGAYRECEILDADASTQRAKVRRDGSLFNVEIGFAQIQNVCLKYDNGEVVQNFGAPRVTRPESLEFIRFHQPAQVMQ